MVMTAHPGKVKAIVPLIFQDLEISCLYVIHFGALFKEIWQLLQEEVLKAKSTEMNK